MNDKPIFITGMRFKCGHTDWYPCDHEIDEDGFLTGRTRVRCWDCKELLFDYADKRPALKDEGQ